MPSAARYRVAIRIDVKREIERKATEEKRAELGALIARYADGGPHALPRTKFNGNEGWFPSERAPAKVRLEAFKPWQLRAYGFCRSFDGQGTFFITGVDIAKKQNRADQARLRSAGAEAVRLNSALK